MAVFEIARYEVRPEARVEAERAMFQFADYVRHELPGSSWTTYREPRAPTRYMSLRRADDATADDRHRDAPGTRAFLAALAPLLVGTVEVAEYELVTSSDLARRVRPDRRAPRPRRRPR
jgi:quinol monooxygenase YgiN